MAYIDDIKAKLKSLELTNDIKEAEIQLLLNDREEVTAPGMYMTLASFAIMDMLFKNKTFQLKRGVTPEAKAAEETLNNLYEYVKKFDAICTQNYNLKYYNKEILAKNMLLRVEVADLKNQIETYHATTKEL